ncbi:hypothetical protein B484DRAFT_451638 [Ochromonadaceae sp. CCMP2298]|nr:hypothetical protein B484DRAFT_451638 [Ochromonadaceae sp. CCMP2298]
MYRSPLLLCVSVFLCMFLLSFSFFSLFLCMFLCLCDSVLEIVPLPTCPLSASVSQCMFLYLCACFCVYEPHLCLSPQRRDCGQAHS